MATFHFDLVSPENFAFSGEVVQVDVPGVEGDFGVLAGVRRSSLRSSRHSDVTTAASKQKIIVLGGLAEVSPGA